MGGGKEDYVFHSKNGKKWPLSAFSRRLLQQSGAALHLGHQNQPQIGESPLSIETN